jgi:hypothetical protein
VAGAAVWLRPDAGLAVALLGLQLWAERRRPPWRYAVAAGAVIAAGLAAALLWFGRALPATLEAKRVHAAWLPWLWRSGGEFWPTGLRQLQMWFGDGSAAFAALGLAGHAVLIARGGRALRLVALYSLATLISYPLLGVPFYVWYAVPVVVAGIYGAAFAAGAVGRWLAAYFGSTAFARALGVAAALALAWPVVTEVTVRSGQTIGRTMDSPRWELYRRVGLWLREHTAPSDRVGYVEIGEIAFYSRRPFDDLLGLVTPRAVRWVARGDLAGAVRERPPEVLLFNPPLALLLDPILEAPWFPTLYREAARIPQPHGGDELVVYRRREAPAPAPEAAGVVSAPPPAAGG